MGEIPVRRKEGVLVAGEARATIAQQIGQLQADYHGRGPSAWISSAVHDLVGRDGYLLSVPPSGPPAPVDSVASQRAAHIRGIQFGGGATAMRQGWYRHAPKVEQPEPFRSCAKCRDAPDERTVDVVGELSYPVPDENVCGLSLP